jgi:hypothetical protein
MVASVLARWGALRVWALRAQWPQSEQRGRIYIEDGSHGQQLVDGDRPRPSLHEADHAGGEARAETARPLGEVGLCEVADQP